MEITNIKINIIKDSNILAIATITLNDVIVISGIRLYEGKNGYYIIFPARRNKNNKKYNVVYPCNNELREKILKITEEKYVEKLK